MADSGPPGYGSMNPGPVIASPANAHRILGLERHFVLPKCAIAGSLTGPATEWKLPAGCLLRQVAQMEDMTCVVVSTLRRSGVLRLALTGCSN